MPTEKEINAIRHIHAYCEKIDDARKRFLPSRSDFDKEELFRDGCAFYIQQIGEFVNDLSDEFIASNADIAWHQIRGFRNIIAHAYGSVDADILWESITEDIPRLERFCQGYLEKHL